MKFNLKKPSTELDKLRLGLLIVFIVFATLTAWQSDDAYHGYVMAKHLVEGNGFVYNIGQRASATTAPLWTLLVAVAYFFTREMFFTSIALCVAFSAAAFYILIYKICKTKEQIIIGGIALMGSTAFMSYTTSGLENCLLYFLTVWFLYEYYRQEKYTAKEMLKLALIFSGLALARMDAVLLLIPMICYVFLMRRKSTSFFGAVGIGILGLLPFFLWELFSLFYFGFPVPNTAYVKLGTDIATSVYIKKGVWYIVFTGLNDLMVLLIPAVFMISTLIVRKWKYLYTSAGIVLYGLYIIYIGGDFMMGRHFTVLFIMALSGMISMINNESGEKFNRAIKFRNVLSASVIFALIYGLTFVPQIGSLYLMDHQIGSTISDEREYYSPTTGFYNNLRSLVKTGHICIEDTWNYQSTDEIRANGWKGNITSNSPGILVYYNSDLYLNDTYCLGDPFLSKLPAIKQENWRIGHMKRAVPPGYCETVMYGENVIEDEDLAKYYDIICFMTEGKLFSAERIRTVIDWNLGKYDYLLDHYISTLEN